MRRLRAPLRLVVLLVLAAGEALRAAPPTAAAFDATPAWPAAFAPRLKSADTAAGDVLRLLTVEERTGEPRADELVRTPLFLHEDEPGDPADWALFTEADTARQHPIVFQLDDLRRDEAGRLTRCHLYFPVTLAAWERQRFVLVRRTATAANPQPPALACQRDGDRVTLAGRDLAVTFLAAGPRAGAITAVQVFGRALELPDGWIAPALTLVRQAPDCTVIRRTTLTYREPEDLEIRDVRYGSGPLFAKFTVRIGPRGLPDSAMFTYRVPAHGAVLVQTERLALEGEPSAEVVGTDDHRLLAGRLRLGPGRNAEVVRVPAGLRRLTRATQGHFLDALVDRPAGLGLLPVPYVQTGGGAVTLDGDTVAIAGASSFRRNTDGHSASLRAFWGELRFAFTIALDPESLWQLARRQFQPLVAVVDEPALGPDDCLAFMPAIARRFRAIPYWGRNWTQDAALLRLERNRPQYDALLARRPGASESNPSVHLPGWARATPPQPRNPKDQGRIDPYHLAYGSSVIPLLHRWAPHPRLPSVARAIGAASHQAFGRVNAAGFPRVDCFASALNMQLGPLGLALFGANETGDTALAAWARDALHAPGVTAIYGHGQRPYPGEIGRPDPSDLLYEGISEFQLRSLELSTGEDLWLHPAALGRYFDCVDVTADLQHRAAPGSEARSWSRANFFRGQAHDHRWEGWSCNPLVGLFAHAADRGRIGTTEAAYWLDEASRRKQAWSELMWYTHADLLLALADQPVPRRPAPPLPADLTVRRARGANHLAWSAVAGATGYRIYRAPAVGGPWTWLNSPYRETPAPLVTGTAFDDPDGHAGDEYLVTAVDAAGRESRWYADEPPRD